MLDEDDSIGLAPLIDYYTALAGKTGHDFLDASSREIYHLGLLPDPEFFNDPHEAAVRRRLERNRELSSRLQMLNAQDRRRITEVLQAETDPTTSQGAPGGAEPARPHPGRGRRSARRSRSRPPTGWCGRGSRSPSRTAPSAPRRRRSPKVAAEALVDEDRAEDVAAIVENLQPLLNALDEGKLRPETIRTKLPDGTTEAVTTARLDLLNLLGKVLGEDTYGGLIEVDAPDLESALRRFDVEQHLVARWQGDRIGEFLAAPRRRRGRAPHSASCFAAYVEAREPVLPWMRTLAVEPLAVAAHPPTRAAAPRASSRRTRR